MEYHFSTSQMERYECYRRSNISKPALRKLFYNLTGVSLNANGLIILSSIVKMFIGELTECSRSLLDEQGYSQLDEIRPKHVFESARRIHSKTKMIRNKQFKKFKRGYISLYH